MHHYHNLVEAIIDLETRGFTLDFTFGNKSLFCVQSQSPMPSEEFSITEVYHFTARNKKGYVSLYVIEASAFCVKGILLKKPTKSANKVPKFFERKLAEYINIS